ncbi:RluA family pseudouridine synthase [Adhaeribacter sp. BT258]|uniref:RluA family pseudouridine synthase n=1 Tax=Adhaeribacter terrigena TaxID=2793070 RepID=A0ABS1C029_9BACT|nr:RluA family pseudouridine synthase [Adhaeribacter terrigena]MBK0401943.1 RluA family pseudouridine synthase [Adhaeribacter terrigena]
MLDVLYEDNHLLVVNKPAGLLVQGDATGDVTLPDLAKEYLREKYNKPGNIFVGVVHRLDRPVSGVVVLAKTSKALARMNELFRSNKTTKTYLAISLQKPNQTEARLEHWLVKDPAKNITKAFSSEKPGSQRAELRYKLLMHREQYYLMQVNPVTGRPHQIRVQMASQKSPLLGDVKYGAPALLPDKRIGLHAYQLEFEHPVQKTTIKITAPLPNVQPWKIFRQDF